MQEFDIANKIMCLLCFWLQTHSTSVLDAFFGVATSIVQSYEDTLQDLLAT